MMTYIKDNGQVLVAEDLSGIGNLSLTVAIPILQAQGVPLALLPTSVLSTQTEGFGQAVTLETSTWMEESFNHWNAAEINFAGALIGYLGSVEVQHKILQFLQKKALAFCIIDPVFADQGALYPNITDEQIIHTKELLQYANVITPNLTEACFLTGMKLRENSADFHFELLTKLNRLTKSGGQIVITGISQNNQRGCVWLENGHLTYCMYPELTGHFYGSGDTFSALLTGYLWKKYSFGNAVKCATKLTYQALQQTERHKERPRKYGVILTNILSLLSERKEEEFYE